MNRVAVVGDGVLAYSVARQLTTSAARVVLHRTRPDAEIDEGGAAYLRLLDADAARLAKQAAALQAWQGLARETGIQMMSRADAVDVGPAVAIATTLHETAAFRPARALHPVEAARNWPGIRWDGLVAHQDAARRVHLQIARDALQRSARLCGVRIDTGPAIRVRSTQIGGADVFTRGRWVSYDAALVIAGPAQRARLLGAGASAEVDCVLEVDTIGPPAGWPSVVHRAGLPPDPDGHELPGCRAELDQGRIELRLEDGGDGPAAGWLWEYAARWLPGTIVSTARVRTEAHMAGGCDTVLGGLLVAAPLAARDRALAPVFALDLARGLLETVALDLETERAS